MADTASTTTNSGLSFGTVLFIVFLVLKLTGVIAWSWWWVTAPLWIPFAIVAGVLLVGVLIWGVASALGKR